MLQVVLISISSLTIIGCHPTDDLKGASHVHKVLANFCCCCCSTVFPSTLMSLFSLIISLKILPLKFILSFIAALIGTMTALLARFFTGTTRGDPSQEGPTRPTAAQAESARKLRKSHSTSVKARKSMTSLFGFPVKLTPAEDRLVKIP